MALKIRLARGGAKNVHFTVLLSLSVAPRDNRYVERVGTYNPMVPKDHEARLTLNAERITCWMGQGAQPTERVQKMLAGAGLAAAPVIRDQPKKSAVGKKRAEREAEAAAELPRLQKPLPQKLPLLKKLPPLPRRQLKKRQPRKPLQKRLQQTRLLLKRLQTRRDHDGPRHGETVSIGAITGHRCGAVQGKALHHYPEDIASYGPVCGRLT